MAEQLSATVPLKPARASVRTLEVLRATRLSDGFVRVTLASVLDGFEQEFVPLGRDQWLRLFLPPAGGSLALPHGEAEGWYSRMLAMPEEIRPVVRNYTIREARRAGERWELDLDFVVHRGASGEVEGLAAGWALAARHGDLVGVLDQGAIFNPPADAMHLLIVSDETGLPGVEGIARDLAGDERATYLVETREADRRDLGADGRVTWIDPADSDASGDALLRAVREVEAGSGTYAYVVGEAAFVLAARKHLRESGVPDVALHFCAYWRSGRRAR